MVAARGTTLQVAHRRETPRLAYRTLTDAGIGAAATISHDLTH